VRLAAGFVELPDEGDFLGGAGAVDARNAQQQAGGRDRLRGVELGVVSNIVILRLTKSLLWLLCFSEY